MPIYRGVDNVVRQVTRQFRGVANVNKELSQEFRNVNGTIRNVFDTLTTESFTKYLTAHTGNIAGYTNYSPIKNSEGNMTLNTWSSATASSPQYSQAYSNSSPYFNQYANIQLGVTFNNGFHINKETYFQVLLMPATPGSTPPSLNDADVVLSVKAGDYPLGVAVLFNIRPQLHHIQTYRRIVLRIIDRAGQTSGSVTITHLGIAPM